VVVRIVLSRVAVTVAPGTGNVLKVTTPVKTACGSAAVATGREEDKSKTAAKYLNSMNW
jgi:hypothetical protein